MPKAKILVVEDERVVARDIQKILLRADYAVPSVAASGEEAIVRALETKPDLILMDIVLQGAMTGIEAAERIRRQSEVPVVYLTAYGDEDIVRRAKATEPIAYIMKPYEEHDLLTSIEVALHQYIAARERSEAELRASEEKYRRLVDNALVGVYQTSLDGTILFANPELVRMLDFDSPADLIGAKIIERYKNPEDRARLLGILKQEKQVKDFEIEVLTREGQSRTVLLSAALEDETLSGMIRDITEHKQAEEQNRFMATLVASVSDAIVATDMQLNIQSWNTGAEAMYGWKPEEVIGRPAREALDTDFLNVTREAVTKQIMEKGSWSGEVLQQRRDGTRFPVLSSVALYKDSRGQSAGVVAVNRDITERKQAELRVQHLARLYATLSQVNQAIVRVKDHDELFMSICRVAVEYGKFGLAWIGVVDRETGVVTPAAVYGAAQNHLPFRTINYKEAPFRDGLIGQAIYTGKLSHSRDIQTDPTMQYWRAMAEGADFHAAAALPFRLGGEVFGFLKLYAAEADFFEDEEQQSLLKEMALDISFALDGMEQEKQRQQAEEALENQARLLELSYDAIFVWELGGAITFWNRGAETLYGYSAQEAIGQVTHLLLRTRFPIDYETFREELVRQEIWTGELIHTTRDGRTVVVESRHQLVHLPDGRTIVFETNRDITERKQAEAERERLLGAIEASLNELYMFDPQTLKFEYVNQGALRNLGYSMDQMSTLTPFDLKPDFTEASFRQMIEPLLQGEKDILIFETRHRRADGSLYPVEVHLQLVQRAGNPVFLAVIIDITERKQAEEKLAASESELRALFAAMQDVVIVYNQEGRYLKVAPTRPGLLIRPPAELLGKTVYEVLPREQADEFLGQIRSVIHTRQTADFEYTLPINGQETWFSASISPLSETSVIWVARDITERKQADIALRESETRFSNAFEYAAIGMALVALDGRWLRVNRALCNIVGYSEEELLAKTFQDITHPDDLEADLNYVRQMLAGEIQTYQMEKRYFHKQGRDVWILLSVSLVRDDQGQPLFFISQIQDISARKRGEDEIRLQLSRLDALRTIDTAIAGTMDIAMVLRVILEQVTSQLGVDAADVLLFNEDSQTLNFADGRGFRTNALKHTRLPLGEGYAGRVALGRQMAFIPDLQNRKTDFLRSPSFSQEGFVAYFCLPLVAKDSIKGVLEVFLRRPIDPESDWLDFLKTLAGQAAIAVDNATLFKNLQLSNINLERRVEERTLELERALKVKDEFLANMSHELRTPLNAVIGLSDSLAEEIAGPLNDKQRKYVNTIAESGQHLLDLINDILDLAKIEAGQVTLDREKVDIATVCQSSLRMVKQLALRKNHEVLFEINSDLDSIIADERRLKQMLVNLLSNAVKFTPEGGRLGLQVRGDRENNVIHFTVWDTGIGIKEEDLPRLFQPFVQLDSQLARKSSGTGLGLALVAQMAALHGGGVSVESQPDQGSRFTITLPWESVLIADVTATPSSGKPQIVKPNPDLQRYTILLVEDAEAVVMVIRDYLEYAGFTVVVAPNGVEAIAMAEAITPSLILMDIQMPVMDGLEATRRIRGIEALKNTPIIALTALAMRGDRERCLEAGMNDYISKPVNFKELKRIIEGHIS